MNETAEATGTRELPEGDTWAQVIARKVRNAVAHSGKIDWAREPKGKGTSRATFEVYFEGIEYRVTVQEVGPEPE